MLLRSHAFYRRVAAWDAPTMLSGAFCDWMVAGGSKSKDMWNMMEQFGASATECTPVHLPTYPHLLASGPLVERTVLRGTLMDGAPLVVRK